jgi:hypothetical protein
MKKFLFSILLSLILCSISYAAPIPKIVALFDRVNIDTTRFKTLLNECIKVDIDGIIMSQYLQSFPYYNEGSNSEKALRSVIDRSLSRCDSAGIKVWFETYSGSKVSYNNNIYYPTRVCNTNSKVAYNFFYDNLDNDIHPIWYLTPNTGNNYRLFYNITCDTWRYYEVTFYITCKKKTGSVGSLGFYRYDNDTDRYYHVSHIDIKNGYNRMNVLSLDSDKWQCVVIAGADSISVIPLSMIEKVPDSTEVFGTIDSTESMFWTNYYESMYKLRPKNTDYFSTSCPDVSNKHGIWGGYNVTYKSWNWLKGLNHPCLEGIVATDDEPTGLGYQYNVLQENGSAGKGFSNNMENFCEFGYVLTGKPVMLWSDPFDPFHNGQKLIRANNPYGGGFSTCVMNDSTPCIYMVWNEDNMQSLEKSINYWANSGKRWGLALYIEYNNTEQAANYIRALPLNKRPEFIMFFTWKTELINEVELRKVIGNFNGIER